MTQAKTLEKPRVVLTGGGSGGHIYPLLATVERLGGRAELHVIIENGDIIIRELFQDMGCKVYEIDAGKLRRYHGKGAKYFFHPVNMRENLRDAWRGSKGIVQALRLLRRIRPSAVFSKGGYVALPVGIAASILSIDIVTHDSDVLPGATNRILSRWARWLAVGFPREYYDYPSRKVVHTGIPVRSRFVRKKPKSSTRNKKPLIVVVGGSLGARRLNTAVFAIVGQLTAMARVAHVTGPHDLKVARQIERKLAKGHYKTFDFVGKKYPDLIMAADVVICRAGATTIAECSLAGTPMIVVPNPMLTGGHQLRNGEALAEAAAATVIDEAKLMAEPELLLLSLQDLLSDSKRMEWQQRNAAALFPVDAAERIANLLMRVTDGKTET